MIMKTIKEALVNLLKVKSVVTVILTLVFAFLSIISGEQFLTIFSVVIAFYFGTQYQKGVDNKKDEL